MRVFVVTSGSHGDVHPFLAIGQELLARRHDVVFFTHPYFEPEVEAAGLELVPICEELDVASMMRDPELMHPTRGGPKILRMVLEATPSALSTVRRGFEERPPDVVVSHPICFGVRWLCEEKRTPWVTATLSPLFWFSPGDPVPTLQKRPGSLRRRAARTVGRMILPFAGWFGDRQLNPVRVLAGFEPQRGTFLADFHGGDLNLGMWSPAFRRPTPEDPPRSHVCGFAWHDRSTKGDVLPARVEEFLEAGPPPVIFTLGTAAVLAAGDFYQIAAEASRRIGGRALLMVGPSPGRLPDEADDLLAWDYLPFSLVLPRGRTIVHHGGIGSAAQALRAGRPTMTVAHAHDQFHNGLTTLELGTGLMIDRRTLSVKRLATALSRLGSTSRLAARAGEIAEELRGEDGARSAVDRIERLVTGSPEAAGSANRRRRARGWRTGR